MDILKEMSDLAGASYSGAKMDIVAEIGMPAMLGQLAEECAELGKAALKYQRILMGTNPTPVTVAEAKAAIREEATDVKDCLRLLEENGMGTYDYKQSFAKMDRWEDRIRSAKAGSIG